jgi:gliding motility-associated lipoprotein GldH
MAVMTMVIAVIVLSAAACQRRPAMATSRFVHLPTTGWLSTEPVSFTPEYVDSTARYDLMLAVRHSNGYRYCNLSLVADVIGDDSTRVRKSLDIPLADEYGNWSSGGFGALYQATVPLVGNVTPEKASKVVVWQTMAGCDTLHGIVDVGIIARPK